MLSNQHQAPSKLVQALGAYQEKLQNDDTYSRIKKIIESPFIILMGLICTTIFFAVISQALPFVNQFFLIDNIVIGITLSSILWAPLLIVLGSIAHRRELRIYKSMNFYPSFQAALEQREQILEAKLEKTPNQIRTPSNKELREHVIYSPEQVMDGPWFSRYTFNDPFQYSIIDTDDYFELSGKLLIFEAPSPKKLDLHELLLIGREHVIQKIVVLLGKKYNYQEFIQLSKIGSKNLNQIKQLTKQVSSTQTFGLRITKNKLALIFFDYNPFPEIDFTQVRDCLEDLQDAVKVWF